MMLRSVILCFTLIPSLVNADAPPPPQALSQDQMQEIFRALRSNYVDPSVTQPEELNRAAIQGLLARHPHGARLLSVEDIKAAGSVIRPLIHENLSDKVGYLRPATFLAEEIPQWDIALQALAETKADTLILDLRSPAPIADVHAASEILGRFLPKDTPVAKLRRGSDEEVLTTRGKVKWSGKVMLLIDSETSNVAELLAAVLKQKLQAMTIGSRTSGRTAQYCDLPLGESHVFRYAESLAALEDGTSIFGKGLEPDLVVEENVGSKHEVFALSEKEGMKKFVFETERPRMNEAALVAGSNPELDYQIAKSAAQPTGWDEVPLRDLVVQRTMDYLITSGILNAAQTPDKNEAPSVEDKKEE